MAQQWQLADDHPGLAAPFDQRRQFPSHAATRNRRVRYCSKAFPRDVTNHVQHPEPPPTAELVMHEIEGPAGVGSGLDQDGCSGAEGLAARFAFTDVYPSSL